MSLDDASSCASHAMSATSPLKVFFSFVCGEVSMLVSLLPNYLFSLKLFKILILLSFGQNFD